MLLIITKVDSHLKQVFQNSRIYLHNNREGVGGTP